MSQGSPIALGTRGSALALWQAECVRDLLSRECPMRDVELVKIKTLGDRVQDKKIAEIGRTAVFTAELDHALQERRIDIAVHSMKDVETTLAVGLTIGAVIVRGPVEDVLVGEHALEHLPVGARVGTGSLRRAAQLLARRADLRIDAVRGNVATRLEKMDAGEFTALCMARAGLVRLGLGHRIGEVFAAERFLPAVGQGAICVLCRADDEVMRGILGGLNHAVTAACVRAERALLRALGAGCNVPVGVFSRHDGTHLYLDAAVFSSDPGRSATCTAGGPAADPEAVGLSGAETLFSRGARDLLRR